MPQPARLLVAAAAVLGAGMVAAVPATLAATSHAATHEVAASEFLCIDLSKLQLPSLCVHGL